MEQISTFYKRKVSKAEQKAHPVSKLSRGYSENKLTPITLSGVVIPWAKLVNIRQIADYKVVSPSGLEYFVIGDSEWRHVLSWYRWEEVKIVGLLNANNMTIIPQKVYPKGSAGEKERTVNLDTWNASAFAKKVLKNMNDLVVVPAAVLAVMAL